jgi:hypothetical protein
MNFRHATAATALVAALSAPVILTLGASLVHAATPAATPATAADRHEILDRITDIAVGADRRDWARAQAAFAPEVRIDYTSLFGGQAATAKAGDIVNGWKGMLPGFDATQHLVSNHAVQVRGNTATAQADFVATHRIERDLWTLGGRYDYTLTKLNGAWRVTGLTMTWSWETGDRAGLLQRAAERAKAVNTASR